MLALIDPWILGFSLITVVVTVIMGFRSARSSKSAADFFVAGRSVSVGWNASAISGEYLSAASFMGVAGMVMSSGYDALWYPVCYACGYLFLLLFIAGPLRRFGAYTIPDFAEGRYDSPVFRKIAVVFVLFIGCFYTMPQMKGAGTTLAYIFKDIEFLGHKGLPYWVGVALVGAIITLNVALGGMKGITLVQAVQYWAKMFAISLPVFVLMSVYGGYGTQLGRNAGATGTFVAPVDEFYDETFHVTAINGNSSPLVLFWWELREKVSRALGNDVRITGAMTPRDATQLLLQHRGLHRIRAARRSESFRLATNTFSIPNDVNGKLWEETIRTELRKAGVGTIFTPDSLVVIPATEEAAYQTDYERNGVAAFERFNGRRPEAGGSPAPRPLPAKAPADATWLNPFGPLTTKAAKAAKPVWTYNGPVNIADNNHPLATLIAGSAISLWDSITGGPISLSTNRVSASDAFRTYAGLSKRFSRLEMAAALDRIEVNFSETNPAPRSTWRKRLVAGLEQAGVVIQETPTTLAAYPKAQATAKPIDAKPYALLYTYSLIIALVCGTAGLPHILVRFYTNPDGVAAKRTTMWVMILIGVFYVFPPVFGVLGRNLMPALYDGVGVNGTDGIVLKLPTLLGEKYGVLGSILSGITCAGAFAAFMSTFSGLLVSMTGALAHDVYGRILRPQSTPAERMRMFKFCAIGVGTVAVLLGTLVENFEINFMVGQAFAIAAASYFPLLFMSVWWRGMTTRGAATGMLTGGLLAVAAISLTSWTTFITTQTAKFKSLGVAEPGWFAAIKPYSLTDYWAEHPLLRILCEQPAIWAVPTAIGLMVIVSKLTSASIPKDIRMKMLVLHAPEALGLKQEYIRDHEAGH